MSLSIADISHRKERLIGLDQSTDSMENVIHLDITKDESYYLGDVLGRQARSPLMQSLIVKLGRAEGAAERATGNPSRNDRLLDAKGRIVIGGMVLEAVDGGDDE